MVTKTELVEVSRNYYKN